MLTDVQCRQAVCPPGKPRIRLSDSQGLYLEVPESGSKRWFWKYRSEGKERRLALGSYPAVSLTAARQARARAKLQKADGIDPVQARRAARLALVDPRNDDFRTVALEWYGRQEPQWSNAHAVRVKRQLERDLFPRLGSRDMASVKPTELLQVIRQIEQRGAFETASRGLMLCSLIWRYGKATGRVEADVTAGLRDALTPYRGTHFAAITDPEQFGVLLRAIKAYRGGPVVRAALQLAPLVFVRPGELRAAPWEEINLDAAMWTIQPARMKRRKAGKEFGPPHHVPLSKQAVAILRELHSYTGRGRLVFPGERSHDRPMSENSVRTALISMGYTPEIQTWHGFRATARTLLAEQVNEDPLLIEAQLAHEVKDVNGRAYNRTQYLAQRTAMMQRWADYLDQLENSRDAKRVA